VKTVQFKKKAKRRSFDFGAYSKSIVTPESAKSSVEEREESSVSGVETELSKDHRSFGKAPIDKLWLRGSGTINLKLVLPFKEHSFTPWKTPFLLGPSSFYRFPNGAKVLIYVGKASYEIQVNPSQWDSLRGLLRFLRLLLGEGYNRSYISRIHVSVDIALRIEDVIKSIKVSRSSISKTYNPTAITKRKGGKVKELELGTHFGCDRRRCIAVYNSTEKHGLEPPSTRIERRDQTKQTAIIQHPKGLIGLEDATPFSKVSFHKLVSREGLSKRDLERLELLELKIEKIGYQRAIAEERAKDPKHFNERYRRILKKIEPLDVDLDIGFQMRMKRFKAEALSKAENELLLVMKKRRGKKVSMSKLEETDV
jgi:hypothetical protein